MIAFMAENVTKLGVRGWFDRAWRLVGTGFSFTMFGIGGLILGTIIFPICFLIVRDPAKRQCFTRKLVGKLFSTFIWMMKSLGVLSYEIHGFENASDIEQTLIVANHPSLIDVVFLLSFFPMSECVVKKAITQNPFTRSVAAGAKYISNGDPEIMLNTCIERVRKGSNLIMFPEGTRGDPGKPLKFKMGAAAIAVRADAQILPITIRCTPPTLRKGESWFQIPDRRPHWVFEIPATRSIEDFIGSLGNEREAIRQFQSALLGYYEDRIDQDSKTSTR